MDCYLTERQNNLIKSLVEGLENGTVKDEWILSTGGDSIRHIFGLNDDGNLWRDVWKGVTYGDFDAFVDCGLFRSKGRDKYTLNSGKIIAYIDGTLDLQPHNIQKDYSNRVFIVHGHDEEMKQAVARFIEKVGLETIILHEQPNQGKTIIEKFEEYSDVGYAVVLLSPDDMGYSEQRGSESIQPRARQNVILELGFFAGKLGRSRTFALKRGDLELPSDISGVIWTEYDTANGRWQHDLVKELKAAEYDIDANKIF